MRTLPFACADFTFPMLPHEKVMEIISLLGCTGVDIGLFSNRSHLRPEIEFGDIKQNAAALKQVLVSKNLIASDVYLQLSTSAFVYAINHPEEQQRKYARENFLKLLEYAAELGADHISCLPGMHFPHEEYDRSVERCYEELQWRTEQAKRTALSFGVEAHIGSPFESPKQAETLIRSVPGLSLTLDYTHFIYNGYAQSEVDPLIAYASHFHARGARRRRLQTSMADNIIDYTKIAEQFEILNYSGWIGLEYIWTEWERCNEVDNLSETVKLKEIFTKKSDEFIL